MWTVREQLERESGPIVAAREVVEHAYAHHAPPLVGFGLRLGLDEDEAWDVVQEAHVRLWRHLAGGADVRDPRAWLAAVVYRLAMDRHRVARRVRALRDRLAARHPDAPDNTVDRIAVWRAVDGLPDRQRAALYLHYRLDLPFDAVADAMGITPGAARTLASRGLVALKGRFALEEGRGS